MAITADVNIVATALWPQGDARDPLGVWGGREIITGDASGGSTRVNFRAASDIAGAFLFTCYSANVSFLTTSTAAVVRARLLTNWPDIDVEAGVQGYSTHLVRNTDGSSTFPAPLSGSDFPLIGPNDRFVLLFDPRPVVGAFDIVDLAVASNVLNGQLAFECWGYYWDRQVLNTPGGPRHPGAS